MITSKQYSEFVAGKAQYKTTEIARYCVTLGLIEEFGELEREVKAGNGEKVNDEAGDVLWKIFAFDKIFNTEIDFDYNLDDSIESLYLDYIYDCTVTEFAGYCKKIVRKPDHIAKDQINVHICDFLIFRLADVRKYLNQFNYTIQDALSYNMKKLNARVEKGELLDR